MFEKTREKIKVGQLVDRLNNNALGTLTKNSGVPKGEDYEEEYIELSQGQIASAKILLDKSLPNLQAVVLTGEDGGPVQLEHLTEDQLDAKIDALKEDSNE